jgi:hypothetical protein
VPGPKQRSAVDKAMFFHGILDRSAYRAEAFSTVIGRQFRISASITCLVPQMTERIFLGPVWRRCLLLQVNSRVSGFLKV